MTILIKELSEYNQYVTDIKTTIAKLDLEITNAKIEAKKSPTILNSLSNFFSGATTELTNAKSTALVMNPKTTINMKEYEGFIKNKGTIESSIHFVKTYLITIKKNLPTSILVLAGLVGASAWFASRNLSKDQIS